MNPIEAHQAVLAILRGVDEMYHQDIRARFLPTDQPRVFPALEKLTELGLIEPTVNGYYRSLEARSPNTNPEGTEMKKIPAKPQKTIAKQEQAAKSNFDVVTDFMDAQGNVGFTAVELQRALPGVNPSSVSALAYSKSRTGELIKNGTKFYLPGDSAIKNDARPVVFEIPEPEVVLKPTVGGQNQTTGDDEGVVGTQAAKSEDNSIQFDSVQISECKTNPVFVVKNNSQNYGAAHFQIKPNPSLSEQYQNLDSSKRGFDAGVTLSGDIQIKKNGAFVTLNKPELELVVALVNKAML